MKKFIIKLFVFLLALILPFYLYFLHIQSMPAMFMGSLMGVNSMKLESAGNITSPKIIVTGGSNVVYNISAKALSQEFNMPAYNMGTTAYLGFDFFAKQVMDYANEGDIIILSLENSVYLNVVDYQTVWFAIENHENMQSVIPISYMPNLILNFYNYAQTKIGIVENSTNFETKQEAYTNAGFDEYGDYILEYPDNILQSLYNTQDEHILSEDIFNDYIIFRLNLLNAWADINGVELYLTYSPLNELAIKPNSENTTIYEDALLAQKYILEKCDIPWIGDYSENIMPAELFFNSNNHLNSNGRDIRTQDLINDIRKMNIL